MKLMRLLELHQQTNQAHSAFSQSSIAAIGSEPHNLEFNLGDGFLLKNNLVYSVIRRAAIGNQFIFSKDFNPDYLALPLSQLESFLVSKKIPYFDNVSALKYVVNRAPQTVWNEVTDNLKRNNVFHESAHAVARSLREFKMGNQSEPIKTVLSLLIEESFANACELLGNLYCDDLAHRIFYESNSYIYVPDDRPQLKLLHSDLGVSSAIQFLVYCYLFSNFLHERITDQDLDRILKLMKVDKSKIKNLKSLRSVSKIAFKLNPRFRSVTTVFYLRLHGLSFSNTQLNQIDFMDLLFSDEEFPCFIEKLSQLF